MKAGKLRQRVEIQARTTTQDSFGAPVPSWATVATVWANVLDQGSRELWQAQQVRPDLTTLVTIRYYAGLTPRHRIKYGSRILNIDSVANPDGQKREHSLMCKEEV